MHHTVAARRRDITVTVATLAVRNARNIRNVLIVCFATFAFISSFGDHARSAAAAAQRRVDPPAVISNELRKRQHTIVQRPHMHSPSALTVR
jgi:hypothetical protein